mgnify:CR=1 FL=1
MTTVHNLRKEKMNPTDIYIGRGSIFGNPFTHIKHKKTKAEFVVNTRTEALKKYREYILQNPELLSKISLLKDKRLFCYCKPLSCHGDIIVELLHQPQSLF